MSSPHAQVAPAGGPGPGQPAGPPHRSVERPEGVVTALCRVVLRMDDRGGVPLSGASVEWAWSKLNSNVGDLLTSTSGGGGELVSSGTIFGGAALIGLVNIVLLTAMATIGAFIY